MSQNLAVAIAAIAIAVVSIVLNVYVMVLARRTRKTLEMLRDERRTWRAQHP